MEAERTPLLPANRQQDNSLDTRSQQEISIHTIGSEDNSIHTRSQEQNSIHTSSPLLSNEHQDTVDLTANLSDCSRWKDQLVGIELAGCLHSFSNGMHMVCYFDFKIFLVLLYFVHMVCYYDFKIYLVLVISSF